MLAKLWKFTLKLFAAWSKNRLPSMAAALSYYTLFAITPLLIICIAIAGKFFGEEAAQGQIVGQISSIVGYETGHQIQAMIQTAANPKKTAIAQLMGIVMLLIGATGIFGEIQSGLNIIWEVKADPNRPWFYLIKDRLFSFSIVLLIAFLLMLSLLSTVLFTLIGDYLRGFWGIDTITLICARCFSFIMETILFALMYKILPDVQIKWREVWLGAIVTSVLFNISKFLLDIYLSNVQINTTFGASSSLVVLLIWVYFTAQIFFIGAEITKVFSQKKRHLPKRELCAEKRH